MNIEKMQSIAIIAAKYLSIKFQDVPQVQSHFIILFGNNMIIYSQSFSNEEEKMMFRNTACLIMKAFNATGYIILNEAWSLPESMLNSLTLNEVKAIQRAGLENHPDRIELLAITGENDTHLLMTHHKILRNETGGITHFEQMDTGHPEVFEKNELTRAEGIFTNCLIAAREIEISDFILESAKTAFTPAIQTIDSLEEQLKIKIN